MSLNVGMQGVKIYDTNSQMRIIFIDRPADSPRADLFKCTLHWQDDSTLLIAWADQIRVARIRARQRSNASPSANLPPLVVEITAVFQLDCMIAGIVPHVMGPSLHTHAPLVHEHHKSDSVKSKQATQPGLTSFLILSYTPPDTSLFSDTAPSSAADQARKAAERPELRIISRSGEELTNDALTISGYERWGCNDYVLVSCEPSSKPSGPPVSSPDAKGENKAPLPQDDTGCYVVLSPKDIVVVRPRDWRDRVAWLVERKRYEEALEEIERHARECEGDEDEEINAVAIGEKYISWLVGEGMFLFCLSCESCPRTLAPQVTLQRQPDCAPRCAGTMPRDGKTGSLCSRRSISCRYACKLVYTWVSLTRFMGLLGYHPVCSNT
jgi:vacuolar protein sorting-associated protein 41